MIDIIMWRVIFVCLITISFSCCQLNGNFWWTDSRIGKFHKVKIPDPLIEEISPFETDESAKIVFRDSDTTITLSPIYNKKKFNFNATTDICHYVKRNECQGIIYSTKYGKSVNKGPRDSQLVCCLEAPSQPPKEDWKIYFPDFRKNNFNAHKSKRSVKINEKRPSKVQDPQIGYDEDPYWNIKNSNFHNSQINEKDDITNEYVDELPRPGLIGIYSDAGRKPSWSYQDKGSPPSYGGGNEYDEVEDTPSFGYGSIDPRRETKTKRKLKPLKLQTPSGEIPYNAGNQIISYQSNPDFKVFEGFKLLNLAKGKIKGPEEINDDNRSEEIFINKPLESISYSSEEYFSPEKNKIFNDCGKSVQVKEKGKQSGESTVGSHPWLALVVHTRRKNTVMCYATLIHPRAAITTANCVDNRTSAGEITLIAGMQYLNRSRTSRRIPKVISHPDYIPGDLANNLALLIWQVPLKLGSAIQPACLAEPATGQDCMFFGWGGFRSGIRSRSKWQRGIVRACNSRVSANKGINLPLGSFCVSVEPQRPVVTGLGGPLICNVNGRDAVVGVSVIRQHSLVLLPVQDWATQANEAINEEN